MQSLDLKIRVSNQGTHYQYKFGPLRRPTAPRQAVIPP